MFLILLNGKLNVKVSQIKELVSNSFGSSIQGLNQNETAFRVVQVIYNYYLKKNKQVKLNKFKTDLSVIKSVIKSNENRSKLLLNRIYEILNKKIRNKKRCNCQNIKKFRI